MKSVRQTPTMHNQLLLFIYISNLLITRGAIVIVHHFPTHSPPIVVTPNPPLPCPSPLPKNTWSTTSVSGRIYQLNPSSYNDGYAFTYIVKTFSVRENWYGLPIIREKNVENKNLSNLDLSHTRKWEETKRKIIDDDSLSLYEMIDIPLDEDEIQSYYFSDYEISRHYIRLKRIKISLDINYCLIDPYPKNKCCRKDICPLDSGSHFVLISSRDMNTDCNIVPLISISGILIKKEDGRMIFSSSLENKDLSFSSYSDIPIICNLSPNNLKIYLSNEGLLVSFDLLSNGLDPLEYLNSRHPDHGFFVNSLRNRKKRSILTTPQIDLVPISQRATWAYSKSTMMASQLFHLYNELGNITTHEFVVERTKTCQNSYFVKLIAYHVFDHFPLLYLKLHYPGHESLIISIEPVRVILSSPLMLNTSLISWDTNCGWSCSIQDSLMSISNITGKLTTCPFGQPKYNKSHPFFLLQIDGGLFDLVNNKSVYDHNNIQFSSINSFIVSDMPLVEYNHKIIDQFKSILDEEKNSVTSQSDTKSPWGFSMENRVSMISDLMGTFRTIIYIVIISTIFSVVLSLVKVIQTIRATLT